MAGITQLVDERIEAIRKERAELAELRESLEKQQAALEMGFGNANRNGIDNEIATAQAELQRIRDEKAEQLMRFGAEMDKLRDEKTAESEKRVKELGGEIAFLVKGRKELEDELIELRGRIAAAKAAFEDELVTAFTSATIKAKEKAARAALGAYTEPSDEKVRDGPDIDEEMAKLKLEKIAEIEEYLVNYKEKRLAEIEKELAKPKAKPKPRASKARAQE